MPNLENYTAELERFKNTYNMPNYDLNELATSEQSFKYVNDIITKGTIGSSPADQFIDLATKTLYLYFEANTNINANGKYLSSFPKNFLKDFDKLADAKYRSEFDGDDIPERKPFAGASKTAIKRAFAKSMADMNKPLPTLWKDRLKKGSAADINNLITTTMNIMEINDNPNADKTGFEDKIVTVVAAHEALKQLRKSREGIIGWFWKLFNGERNNAEEVALDIFEKQVGRLSANNYDVNKIAADLTGKTVFGLEVEGANKAKEAQPDIAQTVNEEKKVENTNIKEPILNINLDNVAKKENTKSVDNKAEADRIAQAKKKEDAALKAIRSRKSEGKVKSLDDAQDLLDDSDINDEINEKYEEYLEKSSSFMKTMAFKAWKTEIKTILPTNWENFAKATKQDQKNAAMREFAFNMFKTSFNSIAYDIDDLSITEQIVAAQKMTDAALKAYTPADSESKYAEYSDNYFVKHATIDDFKKLTKSFKLDKNIEDIISESKAELIPQNLSIPSLSETSNATNQSQKIDETKIDNPNIAKNK